MITERRQIVFSNQMLIQALAEFDRDHERKFLPGKAITCTVSGDEQVRAVLSFGTLAEPDQSSIEIETNRLAAALLRYCMKHRIPIPRRAKKVLRATGDGVSLNFALTHRGQETIPLSA